MDGLEKIKAIRVDKLNALREAGVEPYPYRYERSHFSSEVLENEADLAASEQAVSVAGRVVALRGHGATTFGHVQDREGKLQFYMRRDEVGEDRYRVFKHVEVGDVIGVEGIVFRTRTDEVTIRVQRFEVLSKAIRPLPEKWHGLQDKELRYRQRYVDLIMSEEVRNVFYKRSRLMQTMREFLLARQYVEVETPILQPIYGGAAARPFTTHHNALDIDLYLRIADELYLKRLLVGGFERVFEFAKDFRNEGIDRSHNPEFTMMECYSVFEDYNDFMNMVEEMMRVLADELGEGGKVVYQGNTLDFTKPWRRVRFFDALAERTQMDFRGMSDDEVRAAARSLKVGIDASSSRGRMLDDIFSDLVEPTLIDPTFVYDYPKELSPLAKDHRSEEGLVERFEPFMCGFEVGNAFSELNDPMEQRRRFEQQAVMRATGDDEAHMVDEDFVRALEYGMPPAAGLGLGVDRLTMVFTDSRSIRDVIFFPQMRPE